MSNRKVIVGVMGAGDCASELDVQNARLFGAAIAQRGWVLLTGGRNCGVMAAATEAAAHAGGLTVGLLPDESGAEASPYLDLCLPTGLGSARNQLNVLACDALIICANQMGPGTLSELALGLKAEKPVWVVGANATWVAALKQLQPTPCFVGDVDSCLANMDGEFGVNQP